MTWTTISVVGGITAAVFFILRRDIGNLRKDVHKDIENLREDVRENRESIKRLIETTSGMAGYLTRSFGTDFKKSQKISQQTQEHVGVSEESKKYNKQ